MVVRIDYDDSSDMEEGLDTEEEFQTGRWTAEEHERFLQGLALYNKQWKLIADLIRTRTVVQVRTHAQKHFQKVAKLEAQSGRPHDTDDDDSGYGNSSASTSSSTSTSQLSFNAYPPPSSSSSSSSARPTAAAAAADGCRRLRRASAIAAASTISAAARTAELESPDPPSPKRRKSSHERSARAASFSSSAGRRPSSAAAPQRAEPADSPAFSKSAAQLAQGAGLHVRSTFPFAQPFDMPRRSPTSVAEISVATMLAPSGAAAALGLAHPWPQHASSTSVLSFPKPMATAAAALNNQLYRAPVAAAADPAVPSPWLSGGYGDSYSTHETASSGSGTESEEWGSESGLSGGRGSADILELDLPFGDTLLSDDTTVFDAIGALSPAAAGTPANGALPDFARAFAADFTGDSLDLLEPIPLVRAGTCLAVKSAPAAAAAATAAAGGCFAASPLAAAAEEEQDLDRFVCSLLQVPPQQQGLA